MSTFIESTLNQIKNAWCSIAPQYYLNYQIESGGKSLGFSAAQINAGKFQFQAPGCDPPAQPNPPASDYPENSTIDVPIYGTMPSSGSGTIEVYYGYNANSYNLLTPGDGGPDYCNVSSPASNPLGPTLDTTRIVNYPVTAKIEIFRSGVPRGCGLSARMRIKQRTGGDILIPVAGPQSPTDFGNTFVFSFLDGYLRIPGGVVPPPRQPPVTPPTGPTNNFNITWNGPTVQINSPISIKTGPVKVNSDNEFYLTLNVSGGPDPYFKEPFNIQINAKPVFKIGSDNNIKTEIEFDIGPDKPLPPATSTQTEFNGSWEMLRCNPTTGQIESVNQTYSGTNFAGIKSALTALNTVLGNWQEYTVNCDLGPEPEVMVGLPMGQWVLDNRFSPTVTFHYIETRESAIARGATYRTLRQVSLPVPQSETNYQDFLDRVISSAEGITYTGGAEGVVLQLPNLKGRYMVNAQTRAQGEALMLTLANICGLTLPNPVPWRYEAGQRFGGRGSSAQLLLNIPMELLKGTLVTPGAIYGPTYTYSALANRASRRA